MILSLDTATECAAKPTFQGFFKIWQSDPKNGESKLLVDKRNTIMYQGSDVLAKALAGVPNAKITHMYIGYANGVPDLSSYTVDKGTTAFQHTTNYGYLRVPLSFAPTFTASDANYTSNIPVFTINLSNGSGLTASGSTAFTTANGARIFEAGLVCSINPAATTASHASDLLFARIAFTPLAYDDNFNLTVSWGVKFTS